jgi:GxxExxY protein
MNFQQVRQVLFQHRGTQGDAEGKRVEINEITGIVIDSAMKVHSSLGAGLLERAYSVCLKHELLKRGLKVLSEVGMPIFYDGVSIEVGYRIDLLVEDEVIIELKSVSELLPVHKAQILTYLRLSQKEVGLLLNFNSVHMRDGVTRVINSQQSLGVAAPII